MKRDSDGEGALAGRRAYSLKVVAELLSVSVRTLQRLIAAGKFPRPIKVGAATRVLASDFEQFIERQRQRGGG